MIKLLVVDDHSLIVDGVRAALADADDIEIVGVAVDGAQVLPLADRLRPDVVLLDVRLPRVDGFACLEMLRLRFPQIKVVMLSVFSDQERIQAALKRGASGY
ncbi:MAG TPA: response regulator transcription factor, partial [Gaiellaceae bacterium]|nr:response regulator transcription factor [Gaiellaceae bacterium]